MKVLIACEFSGRVRDAFIARGHDAISCDLLPTERAGPHIIGDVRDHLDDGYDLMIAHPPCTYLANSGVRWLHSDPERWELMREAAEFFKTLLHAPIKRKALENPLMHHYALDIIAQRYSQRIQPWQFGHPEAKKTCLWLVNVPPLVTTRNVYQQMMRLRYGQRENILLAGESDYRSRMRSLTYQGIADAMADQWGKLG